MIQDCDTLVNSIAYSQSAPYLLFLSNIEVVELA
jgi:hypothetical protein